MVPHLLKCKKTPKHKISNINFIEMSLERYGNFSVTRNATIGL